MKTGDGSECIDSGNETRKTFISFLDNGSKRLCNVCFCCVQSLGSRVSAGILVRATKLDINRQHSSSYPWILASEVTFASFDKEKLEK
jgi:hypothetical protein